MKLGDLTFEEIKNIYLGSRIIRFYNNHNDVLYSSIIDCIKDFNQFKNAYTFCYNTVNNRPNYFVLKKDKELNPDYTIDVLFNKKIYPNKNFIRSLKLKDLTT